MIPCIIMMADVIAIEKVPIEIMMIAMSSEGRSEGLI